MAKDIKKSGHKGLLRIITEHPFFAGLDGETCELLSGCAKNTRFDGNNYLFKEGGPADEFYLLREGRVALEINIPGKAGLTFQTLGPGEIVGVSWLVTPYKWTYDARALEPLRAISLDARCLRGKCEDNHSLGYEMMNRFVPILVQRLQATRLQLLDIYGTHG